MAIVFPAVGENALADKMLKTALSVDENYTLKLYSSNTTPSGTSVAGDFTEVSGIGYTSKTLTRAGWTAASQSSNKASMVYGTEQSWTFSGDGTVYGYYVVGATSGTLLWAERDANAPISVHNGYILKLTPAITVASEN